MKYIRIGNDINVKWTLANKDNEFFLEGKDITIYLSSKYEKVKIKDFTVSGNTVTWTFLGKDQKHTGSYSLELVVNDGKRNMITTDARKFVELTPHCCKTFGGDEPNFVTETIHLESNVNFVSLLVDDELSPVSNNAISNKAVTNALEDKQDKLVSGESIKTINGQSVIGKGDIVIKGDGITEADIAAMGFTKNKGTVTETELARKVDKVSGKGLSTEDFTTAFKSKLESLRNYDDSTINQLIIDLRSDLDQLIDGDSSSAIRTFNEIIAFLEGISDSENLDSIIASIEQQIAGKQDKLVSGTNIKTINGQSVLGKGDIAVSTDDCIKRYNATSDMVAADVQGFHADGVLYALPAGATGEEDDILLTRGDVKTINGQSILGRGDVSLTYTKDYPYQKVWHAMGTVTLQPNIYYSNRSYVGVSTLNIVLATPTNTNIVNEYIIEFYCYKDTEVTFSGVPILWESDMNPTFIGERTYRVHIINGFASYKWVEGAFFEDEI